MTMFEWILVINLFITLYLAYTNWSTQRQLEELEEIFAMQAEIIGRFIRKIANEKVESGEWTEHETF